MKKQILTVMKEYIDYQFILVASLAFTWGTLWKNALIHIAMYIKGGTPEQCQVLALLMSALHIVITIILSCIPFKYIRCKRFERWVYVIIYATAGMLTTVLSPIFTIPLAIIVAIITAIMITVVEKEY